MKMNPVTLNAQEEKEFAESIISPLREPLLVLSQDLQVIAANRNFHSVFKLGDNDIFGENLLDLEIGDYQFSALQEVLEDKLPKHREVRDCKISFTKGEARYGTFRINAGYIKRQEREELILLSFKKVNRSSRLLGANKDVFRSIENVLAHVPAMICTLRGPEHVFELVNKNYLQLVAKEDVIGKTVREVLPEVKNQGFFEILDEVYASGKPYIGKEVPIRIKTRENVVRNAFLDFLYQPTWDVKGNVDGIFVHAIDVTEQVEARKKVEESEKELRKLIDTVPAIIWITDVDGSSVYLNKNWGNYTGQSIEQSRGFGWTQPIHPAYREEAIKKTREANEQQKPFSLLYQLRNKKGFYRWVIDSGRPKYSADGIFEGMVGTVVDVHDEKIKEQEIKEKEHRLRTIVEEATVATAVYTGEEMKIELANDAMINLWGKDRSVIGKSVKEALPELKGQPFLGLLKEVFTSGKTYWGKEDKVDLEINNKLQTGFFNFTYKPLRNEKGDIYGILNMAIDVTEMVESRNRLQDSETRFRQLADLMPEKMMKGDVEGNPIYFNQNWLVYTGSSLEELQETGLSSVIHPEEREAYKERWRESLASGENFEMEFRCRNKEGKYNWHISRGEAVKNEEGNIEHWIATTTEIQKLKEEEKRKEDFLKMVSHELKTPVTSIKGYVQLLLKMLDVPGDSPGNLPVKPSLERIDHQLVRLTRLISEMLDLSRIEENKLELQKEVFSMNDMVRQTVQDISLTNTQHKIQIFNDCDCRVYADKDRIGQVLINFITNAIKYSPESQDIEIRVFRPTGGKVAVSVRDKGIGIEEKDYKNIFKRFYRIGGKSEETYAGFGIGLYLANEIVQRHGGIIEVSSEMGKGSDFRFILSEAPNNME